MSWALSVLRPNTPEEQSKVPTHPVGIYFHSQQGNKDNERTRPWRI